VTWPVACDLHFSPAVSAFFYCKIFLAVRRNRNQIQDLQLQQQEQNVEETTTAAKLRKSMVGTFYVYLVFLACYLPYILVSIVGTVKTTSLHDPLRYYALTLVFLNSSLSPLLYCWKMRQIRPVTCHQGYTAEYLANHR